MTDSKRPADGSGFPAPAAPFWQDPRRLLPILALLMATVFAGRVTEALGSLEFPLDDPYIYLQYARNLARGFFFQYWPGSGYSAGATSALYPWLLVPPFLLGLDDQQVLPWVWGLNILLSCTCIWLAAALGTALGGRAGGWFGGGFLLLNAAWWWGALSGMEVALFTALTLSGAWHLWREGEEPPPPPWKLWLICALLPITRPEGFPIALALILCVLTQKGRWRSPRHCLGWGAALLPFVAVSATNAVLAGHPVPNTAIAKSIFYAPQVDLNTIIGHLSNHLLTLLHGLCVPLEGGLLLLPLEPFALLLALAGVWLTWRAHGADPQAQHTLVFLVLAVMLGSGAALSARGPGQFFRYHHVSLALLSIVAGLGIAGLAKAAVRHISARLGSLILGTTLVLGVLIGVQQVLAWSAVMARAAGEIRGQQVAVGHWLENSLPETASIGLNDAGAIAYYSHRRTFDLVGLTTNHQAQIYAQGRGVLFEHFQEMAPEQRPTHFAIYPNWLAIDPILGPSLFQAIVADRIVVGGSIAAVFPARWGILARGQTPTSLPKGATILDTLDIADLESEAAHGYTLEVTPEARGARWTSLFSVGTDGAGESFGDGGRRVRSSEQFTLHIPDRYLGKLSNRMHLTTRVESTQGGQLKIRIDQIASIPLTLSPRAGLSEVDFALPSLGPLPETLGLHVNPEGDAAYGSYHYWLWLEP